MPKLSTLIALSLLIILPVQTIGDTIIFEKRENNSIQKMLGRW